ncbi:9786_t:CDS:2 [Dentiscutata heterogama]|uniref:9786_t:CDS:1 n=1 Tax=Dentiscutata heterogama TaxID=1316150 RepID=A0ACA9MCA8_9GLOM|nr:9786_t:CDS:2 [Dentiscutata heterogama]
MAQEENIFLKQKEINNFSQILQQNIIISNSKIIREKSSSINVLSINSETEKIIKTIKNIDILDSNNQNTYCEVVSKYSQVVNYDENVLENWLLFDKLDNI